jgi:hypothetical protein
LIGYEGVIVITMRTLTALPLLLGLALPTGEAIGQQAGTTFHRYLVRAVLTAEGLKNLQNQPATALKAGVTKFVESVEASSNFGISITARPPPTLLSTIPMKSPQRPPS